MKVYLVTNYGDGSYFTSYLQFCILVANNEAEALNKAKKLDFERHENYEVHLLNDNLENGDIIYTHFDSDY